MSYLPSDLIVALTDGKTQVVLAHLAQGLDPNTADDQGWTLLMHACNAPDVSTMRHKAVVEALLNAGAQANAETWDAGWYTVPLSLAIDRKQRDLVPLLVAHGADPSPFLDEGPLAATVRDEPTRQALRRASIDRERSQLQQAITPVPATGASGVPRRRL